MNHKDQALFALGLMGATPLALVLLVVVCPVVFLPWMWRGYTCWPGVENE